jgi:hypothetical protein
MTNQTASPNDEGGAAYEFGWQKFRLEVPESWEPGSLQGDDGKGYLRLDDPRMTRLELKWDRATRDNACQEALDLYLKELDRAAARRKDPTEFRRPPKEFPLVSSWPEGMDGRAVRWSARVECVAAFVSCRVCGRLTALQILFPAGAADLGLARRVAGSFRDHLAQPDDAALWSVYRMRFRAPGRWRLKEHRFGPGYAQMQFSGPGGLSADVRRAGPAEIILKKHSLQDWYLGQFPRGLKIDPARIERTEVRGDAVLTVTREPKGLLAAIRRRSHSPEMTLRGKALQGVAWHCPASNRLWAVNVYAADLDAARDAEWRVQCH